MLKLYVNITLTIPVNCDHVITQNVNKYLLTLEVHFSSQNPKLLPTNV